MAQAKIDYQALNDELEVILSELQRDDLDVDRAMTQYARGSEIIDLLEKHLKTAETKIKKLKLDAE